jgi:hypothetical protein
MSYRSEFHSTDFSGDPLPTAAEMLQRAENELSWTGRTTRWATPPTGCAWTGAP